MFTHGEKLIFLIRKIKIYSFFERSMQNNPLRLLCDCKSREKNAKLSAPNFKITDSQTQIVQQQKKNSAAQIAQRLKK